MRILTVIMVVLIVILQYQLWVAKGSIPQVWRLKSQLHDEVAKNKKLLQRNEALSQEVSNLKLAQSALEERARNDLGMVMEGETYYQLVPRAKHSKG